VTIFRKNEIPFFGPLFNGAVVHLSVLGGLIRATAINASRAQRSQVKFYQQYFQERFACLDKICASHQDLKSFEQFAATIYAPHQQPSTGSYSMVPGSIAPQVNARKNSPKILNSSTVPFKQAGVSAPLRPNPPATSTSSKVLSRQAPIVLRSTSGKAHSEDGSISSKGHALLVAQKSVPKSAFGSSSKARPMLSSSQSTHNHNNDSSEHPRN
jgi:hypothetical protein